MRMPMREMYDSQEEYDRAVARALERKFVQDQKEEDTGRIDVFLVELPETHLPADGSEFLIESAPLLARKIGDTFGAPSSSDLCVLPDLDASNPWGANTIVGIKK